MSHTLLDSASKEPYENFHRASVASNGLVLTTYNFYLFVSPVASTQSLNAREMSQTTYTEENKGVPIYWMLGNRVADEYEDFWDGTWADETNLRDQDGDLITVSNGVWTGSAADGTELIVNGVSHAMGQPMVGYGTPGSGAVHSGSTATNNELRRLYSLSQVFRIVAPGLVSNIDQFHDYLDDLVDQIDIDFPHISFSEYEEIEGTLTAQYWANTSDSRTGMRAQRFTTGPHPNGYEQIGIQIGYTVSAPRGAYDLAIYTVDGNGHPDTKVAAITNPAGDSGRHLTFDAPDNVLLSPNTAYALVVVPEDAVTELSFDTT